MATSRRKVALVTGASSGIGRATAIALVEAGFVTYGSVRRPGSAADLEARGVRLLPLDVGDEGSMVAAVRAVEAEHGALDLLVNNAGYSLQGPLEEVALPDLRRQFEVNVFGLLRMSQLVLPAMRARGAGLIVNIGSVGGLLTAPGAGAYHMSKYAVESLSDALRAEVAGFGIDVALLEPTAVRTAFIGKQVATMPETGPDSPYFAFKTALSRNALAMFRPGSVAVIEPEAVARVVVQAATSRRPRTRYRVGLVAQVLPVVRRLLPDRTWDALSMRQLAGISGAAAPRRSETTPMA